MIGLKTLVTLYGTLISVGGFVADFGSGYCGTLSESVKNSRFLIKAEFP